MQAKIALAKGGIIGQGPGQSTQRNFLPHPYSDFIYAIIIEEYGLLGGLVVLALYLLLLYRVIRIVIGSPKAFGALLAVGLGTSLVIQALINMAVAVNLLPVTGQPLPFVSMGGTSLFFTSFAVGIILSVSRSIEKGGETGEDKGMTAMENEEESGEIDEKKPRAKRQKAKEDETDGREILEGFATA
jgi:cell division protein FtsW